MITMYLLSAIYFLLPFQGFHNLSNTGVSLDYATNTIPICGFNKILQRNLYFVHNISPLLVFYMIPKGFIS